MAFVGAKFDEIRDEKRDEIRDEIRDDKREDKRENLDVLVLGMVRSFLAVKPLPATKRVGGK